MLVSVLVSLMGSLLVSLLGSLIVSLLCSLLVSFVTESDDVWDPNVLVGFV